MMWLRAKTGVDFKVLRKVALTVVTMGRGPKKHLQRMFAPSHWMLDKLGDGRLVVFCGYPWAATIPI